jgi:predicted nuclease with RNAse H fold
MICGVDFGARLAGTTAICTDRGAILQLVRVPKNHDADEYLLAFCQKYLPSAVYLDAPLSLPDAYFGRGSDFFFRQCDRMLGAMSPMFLGGLTARAIQLRHRLAPTPVYEVYPRAAARCLADRGIDGYRTTSPSAYARALADVLPLPIASEVSSWHEVDALLAWWSGWRHTQGEAQCFGDPSEGIVWV